MAHWRVVRAGALMVLRRRTVHGASGAVCRRFPGRERFDRVQACPNRRDVEALRLGLAVGRLHRTNLDGEVSPRPLRAEHPLRDELHRDWAGAEPSFHLPGRSERSGLARQAFARLRVSAL